MVSRRREHELESDYKVHLKAVLKDMFPGIMILVKDPAVMTGFPDFLLLYMDKWAALEVKAFETAEHQPNQDYYVDLLGRMSYAAFIYPENEARILDELQFAFRPSRNARAAFR